MKEYNLEFSKVQEYKLKTYAEENKINQYNYGQLLNKIRYIHRFCGMSMSDIVANIVVE